MCLKATSAPPKRLISPDNSHPPLRSNALPHSHHRTKPLWAPRIYENNKGNDTYSTSPDTSGTSPGKPKGAPPLDEQQSDSQRIPQLPPDWRA